MWCVLVAGSRRILDTTPRRIWLGIVGALGTAALLLLAAGVIQHFRVLGRHFAPIAPVLLLPMAFGLNSLWKRAGWHRLVAILFVVLSLSSSVCLRLAPRHAKDDYRTAAVAALEAITRGERVWWCADPTSGSYYGVPMSPGENPPSPDQARLVVNPGAQQIANQPAPQLVIVSKADLFDARGTVHDYLTTHKYHLSKTLPAFTLWRNDRASSEEVPNR